MKEPWYGHEAEVIGALGKITQVTPAGSLFTAFILPLTSNDDSTAPRILAACSAIGCLEW